jgi:3-carboxy-cis,cis-muconate cycloisomerase
VLAGDPQITAHLDDADRMASLFDPMGYQGISQTLIDRLLASLGER